MAQILSGMFKGNNLSSFPPYRKTVLLCSQKVRQKWQIVLRRKIARGYEN